MTTVVLAAAMLAACGPKEAQSPVPLADHEMKAAAGGMAVLTLCGDTPCATGAHGNTGSATGSWGPQTGSVTIHY